MSVVIGDQRPARLARDRAAGEHDEEAAVPVALGEQDLAWLDGPRWPRESSAAIGRRPKAWARACRSGEESQQPTCPQVRHRRRCTQSDPRIRHSSQPPGVRGVTGRTRLRCGSVSVAMPAVLSWYAWTPCWAGRAGRTSADQVVSGPGRVAAHADPAGLTGSPTLT